VNILILGGTVFLGRHLVDAAQARGHVVTLFNRGQHRPDLYPNIEKLRGDRDGGLNALRGRQWDAAIDTSGYLHRVVRQSADLLRDAVRHYTFISTMSVYADLATVGITEASPTVSRPGIHSPPRPDRWPVRSDESLHILAAPHCGGRRSACPWHGAQACTLQY